MQLQELELIFRHTKANRGVRRWSRTEGQTDVEFELVIQLGNPGLRFFKNNQSYLYNILDSCSFDQKLQSQTKGLSFVKY